MVCARERVKLWGWLLPGGRTKCPWRVSRRCSEGHERGCRDVSRTGEDEAAVAASADRVRGVCYGAYERGAAAGAASAKGVVEVVCGHVGR